MCGCDLLLMVRSTQGKLFKFSHGDVYPMMAHMLSKRSKVLDLRTGKETSPPSPTLLEEARMALPSGGGSVTDGGSVSGSDSHSVSSGEEERAMEVDEGAEFVVQQLQEQEQGEGQGREEERVHNQRQAMGLCVEACEEGDKEEDRAPMPPLLPSPSNALAITTNTTTINNNNSNINHCSHGWGVQLYVPGHVEVGVPGNSNKSSLDPNTPMYPLSLGGNTPGGLIQTPTPFKDVLTPTTGFPSFLQSPAPHRG